MARDIITMKMSLPTPWLMALPMPSLHIATIPNVISTTTSDWESTIIWQRIINSALPTPHNSITREELQRMMAISHPFSESMPRVSFTISAWITPHHSASRQEQNTPIIIHRMNNGWKAVSTMRFTTSQASSESTNGTLTSSRSTT